jgi:hypothetical protein
MSIIWKTGHYFYHLFSFYLFTWHVFSNCWFYYLYMLPVFLLFIIYALLLFYQCKLYCTAFFYLYIMSYICYVIHASVMFWFWHVSYSAVSSPMLDLWNARACVCVCVWQVGFPYQVLWIKFCLNHFFHVFCISHIGYLILLILVSL